MASSFMSRLRGAAQSHTELSKQKIQRAVSAVFEPLEDRRLFSLYQVSVLYGNTTPNRGLTAITTFPSGATATSSGNVNAANELAAAQAAITVSGLPSGWTSSVLTAGNTGHKANTNEQSLAEAKNLAPDQIVVGIEDHGASPDDNDFNDYYWLVTVAPYYCPTTPPDSGVYPPPSTSNESCCANSNTPSQEAIDSGSPCPMTGAPVTYADGAVQYAAPDLESDAGGVVWGETRSWTNRLNQASGNKVGNNSLVTQLPRVEADGLSQTRVVLDGKDSVNFNITGSVSSGTDLYASKHFSTDTLVRSGSSGSESYKMTDSKGNVTELYGLNPGIPAAKQGQLKSFTDSDGLATTTTYDSTSNLLTDVRRDLGGGVTESFLYDYYASGDPNAGLVHAVTLRRSTDGGTTWSNVRRSEYSYYEGTGAGIDAFGNLGDLRSSAVIDPAHDLSVSSLTRSGTTATLTTSAAHGYSVGDTVTVDGAAHRQYNGTFVVTGVTSTTLSYTMVSDPGANETSPSGVKVNKAIDDNYYRYYTPRVVSGSSVSWDGSNSTVTLTLSNNGLAVGDTVTVAGVTGGPAQYDGFNGSFRVTAATGTTFSYQVPFVNLSTTAPIGTITAVGNGYAGGMRYIFDSKAFARLSTNVSDPMAATDASVSGYATNYFEYDSNRRVKKEVAQDSGCSTCANGFGTTLLSYATSTNTADYNAWNRRTIEDMSDGNRNVVYTNGYGEMMLKVFQQMGSAVSITGASYASGTATITTSAAHGYSVGDVVAVSGLADNDYNGTVTITAVTGTTFSYAVGSAPVTNAVYSSAAVKKVISQQGDFYHYDSSGRVTLHADPSALQLPPNITAIEANADLMNYNAGTFKYQYLRDSQGLIETTTYAAADSGTITETVAGDAAGYVQSKGIERGQTGTNVPQESFKYYKRTAGGTVYPVALDTVYRLTGGSGAETTTHSYTWYSGTTRKSSMTTTLPLITTTENGPGGSANDTMTTNYDVYGRPTSTTDGDGFVNAMTYDAATGAMTQSVTDSGTGHLNLTTTANVVDNMGRATKTTDPNGNVTYTVYNDANHEMRVYPGWNATTGTTTGPIQIMREDRGHQYTETLTSSATPATSGSAGSYVPTGAETVSAGNIQTLSRDYVNDANQVIYSDRYFNLAGVTYSTAANIGTLNTNYYRTQYDYDARGRLKRTIEPTGTINWNVYDGLGRVVSTWIGTNDTGFTNSDPSGGGAVGNNMKKVADYQYDGGGVGDSHLTKVTQHPSASSSDDRVTEGYYDWRGRLVASKSGVQSGESTGDTVQRMLTWNNLDNLGEATASYTYDGDGLTINRAPEDSASGTDADGVPDQPSSGALRYQTTSSFDEQGRVYRSDTYSVDPSTGVVGNAVESNTFYDHRGNVIKSVTTGNATMKSRYDGAGRLTASYVTDSGGDSGWSDADDVTGDKVLEQSLPTYDADGNVIFSLTMQRDHDNTSTDDLFSSSGSTRLHFQTAYYDAANRITDSVDVGTNPSLGPQSYYSRPSFAPARSDTALVTSYTYNAAGWADTMTDPRGIVSKTAYDLAGRTTKTIAAYNDGTVGSTDNAVDQTTLYAYDGDDHVVTLTALLPDGPDAGTDPDQQVTAYTYGVTSAGGNGIDSNNALKEVAYPDTSTGAAGTTNADKVRYTYDALGEATTVIDQNGTTHTYGYDVLGRTLSDDVGSGTLPTNVDGAVRKITRTYDSAGRLFNTTSYNSSSTVVNQVQDVYNGLGQLTTEYQEHSGSVNTGTSPKVQYAYDATNSSSVLTKASRLTSMTYPNGRVVTYNYNGTTLDDSISRLTSMSDPSATLESYTYLGLGTIVERNHPQSGVNLSLIKQGSEANGEAGDQYNGLDRFGRVIDQRWISGGDPANSSDNGTIDRYQYGYDRDGNVLYKNNLLNSASSELYAGTDDVAANSIYDNLNRLQGCQRGTLSAAGSNNGSLLDTVTTATRTQAWSLDTLGNWGNTTGTATTSVTNDGVAQTQTHNSRNQLTTFDADGTGSGSPTKTLTYDSNGSITTDEKGNTLIYDAWNRLVADKTGATTMRSYKYDGLGRRTQEAPQSGTATDLYLSSGWQVIEEKKGSSTTASNVWSPAYVDALVSRDTFDTTAAGTLDTSFNTTGKLTLGLGATDQIRALVTKDDKVLAVATSGSNMAFVRFNADGTLDNTFDGPGTAGNGKFTIDLGGNDKVRAVAVQPDGKIVIAGETDKNGTIDVFVGRLTDTGAWDTSFNTTGQRIDAITSSATDQAYGVGIDSQGRIVIAGDSGGDVLVARYTSAGALDTTFNTTGYLKTNFSNSDVAEGMAIDGQDRIVAAGYNNDGGSSDVVLERVTTSGTLDSTFGTSGKVTTDFGGTSDAAKQVAIDTAGRIVIGGRGGNSSDGVAGTGQDMIVARYTPAGVLDTTFSTDGKQYIDFGTTADQAEDMTVDSAGRITLAGDNNTTDFALARVNGSDGSLDTTFDTDGKLTTSFATGAGTADAALAIALRPDGRIIAAGYTDDGSGKDLAVAQYWGGGNRYYALQDANYNTTAVVGGNGRVYERYVYDPYGSVTILNPEWTLDANQIQDVDQPFLHQGLRYDATSGLYYARHRDYSPILGRWTERDQIGEYIEGHNLYQADASSPISRHDPLGLYSYEFNHLSNISWDNAKKACMVTVVEYLTPGPLDRWCPGAGWIGDDQPTSRTRTFPLNGVPQCNCSPSALAKLSLAGNQQSSTIYDNAINQIREAVGISNALTTGENSASVTSDGMLFAVGGVVLGEGARIISGRSGSPTEITGNRPTEINGREYSGHALDRMQGRGIPPSAVENTCQCGTATSGNRPGTIAHTDPVNNLTVITDLGSGRVVTVRPGG